VTPTFNPHLVRGICFDVDGTLAESDDLVVRRLARMLRPIERLRSRTHSDEIARRLILGLETPTNALLHSVDIIGLDEILGPMMNFLHRLRGEADMSPPVLVAGVLSTLERLASRYPLAIVTSREHRSTMSFLRATGLAPLFRCVATARTCRRAKPHPSPVLWAAQQLQLPPESCLMVGDTTVDVRAAVAAGAQAVGVLCGFGQREELERAGAHLILDSTADLPAALTG
jgi:HAD superfamily hydrolase (TIGR01509 family)